MSRRSGWDEKLSVATTGKDLVRHLGQRWARTVADHLRVFMTRSRGCPGATHKLLEQPPT